MQKIKNNVWVLYSIIFVMFVMIIIIPSQILSQTFLSFGLFTDGFKQHLIFMQDFVTQNKEFLHTGDFFTYRYDLGLGSDFFMAYTYYSLFDPLTIIAYIIPIQHIEVSYYLIAIVRLYLAGVFLLLLLRKIGQYQTETQITVVLFYVFNTIVLYSFFRHPMFINGAMFFPLIIYGVEKYWREQKSFILVIASFFGFICHFYFFFFVCIGLEIYILLRTFLENKEQTFWKKTTSILKIHIPIFVGVLIGSFVLFPQIVATLSTAKIDSKGFIWFNFGDYFLIFASYFIPLVEGHYTAAIGNFFVLFCIILYSINHKKHWASIMFGIFSIMMLLPIFGYMLNAMSYVNNRWTFLMLIPASLMLANILEERNKYHDNTITYGSKIFIIMLLATLWLGSFFVSGFISNVDLKIVVIVVTLIILLTVYYLCTRYHISKYFIKLFRSKVFPRTISVSTFLVLISVAMAAFLGRVSYDGLKAYDEINTYDVLANDYFSRVDQKKYVLNTNSLANDNVVYGYKSTYTYNTMANKSINQVTQFFDVPNDNATAGYNGFNQRLILNAINHVEYVLIRESEQTKVPYGYTLYDTLQVKKSQEENMSPLGFGYLEYNNGNYVYENQYVYKNNHFLHFGFMYHTYVSKDQVKNLNSVSQESLLLDAIILETETDLLTKYQINDTVEKANISSYTLNGVMIENNYLEVTSTNGTISFTINNSVLNEVFVEISNFKNRDNVPFVATYETDDTKEIETTYAYGTNYYVYNPNHLIGLGAYDGDINVTITLPIGNYTFDAIQYYKRSLVDFEEKIEQLNQETLQNLEFTGNGFSGTITTAKPGMLFIALPYDKGFRAYVNEQEVKIEKANIGYMAIYLEQGSHDIIFVYQTPGLKLGIYTSIAVLSIVLTIAMIKNIKSKRKGKTHEVN